MFGLKHASYINQRKTVQTSPFIPNDIYKVIIGAILAFLGTMILRQVFQSKSINKVKKPNRIRSFRLSMALSAD